MRKPKGAMSSARVLRIWRTVSSDRRQSWKMVAPSQTAARAGTEEMPGSGIWPFHRSGRQAQSVPIGLRIAVTPITGRARRYSAWWITRSSSRRSWRARARRARSPSRPIFGASSAALPHRASARRNISRSSTLSNCPAIVSLTRRSFRLAPALLPVRKPSPYHRKCGAKPTHSPATCGNYFTDLPHSPASRRQSPVQGSRAPRPAAGRAGRAG